MTKGIFITGTGTDIGKTIASSFILRYLKLNKINAAPMKPIQTGCEKKGGKLISPDLEFALDFSGLKAENETKQEMSPFQFIPACSPHLAAEMPNTIIDLDKIKNAFNQLSERYDYIIAEGAGGLLVPISPELNTIDLIKKLELEIIIVSSTGLGTINHTLMTIETAKQHGLKIKGIIFNNISPVTKDNEFIRNDNPEIIKKISGIKILGNIPFMKELPKTDDDFLKMMNKACPELLEHLKVQQ